MVYITIMGALIESSRIITEDGSFPVKDIREGSKVLTRKGYFKKITKIDCIAYEGPIYTIKTKHFNESFSVLKDFDFYACKAYKCKSTQFLCRPGCKHAFVIRKGIKTPNCKMGYKFYKYLPIPVQGLTQGDLFTYPIFRETHEETVVLAVKDIKCKKKLPTRIEVTPELMRLFGYYLAEGCYSKRKIIFTFNKKEDKYIEDVLHLCEKYFGLTGKIRFPKNKTKKSVAIVFDSIALATFIEDLFGKLSKCKKIPPWCLFLREAYLIEFFKGWAFGDGGFKNDSFAITTINENFAFKMGMILNKIGVIPYSTHFSTSKGNKVHRLTISAKQLKNLEEKTGIKHPNENRGKKANKYFYLNKDESLLCYPIESIIVEGYKGLVYKLEIEGNEDYVVNYALTA